MKKYLLCLSLLPLCGSSTAVAEKETPAVVAVFDELNTDGETVRTVTRRAVGKVGGELCGLRCFVVAVPGGHTAICVLPSGAMAGTSAGEGQASNTLILTPECAVSILLHTPTLARKPRKITA